MKIENQNFLITGANRGIGLATAEMAAQEKGILHLVMRSNDNSLVTRLKKKGAQDVKIWIADLSTRAGVEQLVEQLKNERIDILFNNAGLLTGGLLEDQPLDEIYSMFQVNITALVHLTRGLLPAMIAQGHGKVINNSSVSAFMHFPCATTYAASKAAVVAFTDCLQAELNGTGVNTLCLITPGIKTRMFDEIEVKYGQNFEVPNDSMSTQAYAQLIRHAILKDDLYLTPSGLTAIGLWTAKFLPGLFRKESARRFKR